MFCFSFMYCGSDPDLQVFPVSLYEGDACLAELQTRAADVIVYNLLH